MSNRKLTNSEINIKTFMLILWEEKILILGLCLFFSISAFFYQYSKVNKNEQIITIHINDPKLLVAQVLYFESFLDEKILPELYSKSSSRKDLLSEYTQNFKNNFLSRNNFVNFINQNKNSNELRMWFKENKIDIKYYLNENKFKSINDKKFYITLPSGLDKLSIIIDEYVFFVKDLTIEEIRKTLKLKILSELKRNEQALVYAKKISLLNPLIHSDKDNNSVKIVSEPKEIFYLGEKILIEKINNLNKLITEVSSYDFNYDPILIHTSIENVTVDRVFMSTMAGLLFGLFLSISIIYLKNFKKN